MSLLLSSGLFGAAQEAPLTTQAVWGKRVDNPALSPGGGGWRDQWVGWPSLFYDSGTYRAYFAGSDGASVEIGLATSTDLQTWSFEGSNPVLTTGTGWDSNQVRNPVVWVEDGTYYMFYEGFDGTDRGFGFATSSDGVSWTKDSNNPVFTAGSGFDSGNVLDPFIEVDSGEYNLYYSGNDGSGNVRIGHATSTDLINWTRDSNNPVLGFGTAGQWDDGQVRCSSARLINGTWYLWYGGDDGDGDDRKMGLATSSDGSSFTRDGDNPILARGDNWENQDTFRHGVEYDGTDYHVIYTGQSQQSPDVYDIGVATLTDVAAGLVDSWDSGVTNPKYVGDTAQLSTTGSVTFEGGQSLTGATSQDRTIHAPAGELNYHPQRGDIVDARIRIATAPVNVRLLYLGPDRNNTYAIAYNTGADILRILRIDSGSVTELASASVTEVTGEWLRIETDLDSASDGTIEAEAFDSTGTSLGNRISANDTTYNDSGFGVYMNGSSGNRAYVDEVEKTN